MKGEFRAKKNVDKLIAKVYLLKYQFILAEFSSTKINFKLIWQARFLLELAIWTTS